MKKYQPLNEALWRLKSMMKPILILLLGGLLGAAGCQSNGDFARASKWAEARDRERRAEDAWNAGTPSGGAWRYNSQYESLRPSYIDPYYHSLRTGSAYYQALRNWEIHQNALRYFPPPGGTGPSR